MTLSGKLETSIYTGFDFRMYYPSIDAILQNKTLIICQIRAFACPYTITTVCDMRCGAYTTIKPFNMASAAIK